MDPVKEVMNLGVYANKIKDEKNKIANDIIMSSV